MRPRLPSLQALVCFEAAARHGSYTRAAVEVALTQGSASGMSLALVHLNGLAWIAGAAANAAAAPAASNAHFSFMGTPW